MVVRRMRRFGAATGRCIHPAPRSNGVLSRRRAGIHEPRRASMDAAARGWGPSAHAGLPGAPRGDIGSATRHHALHSLLSVAVSVCVRPARPGGVAAPWLRLPCASCASPVSTRFSEPRHLSRHFALAHSCCPPMVRAVVGAFSFDTGRSHLLKAEPPPPIQDVVGYPQPHPQPVELLWITGGGTRALSVLWTRR